MKIALLLGGLLINTMLLAYTPTILLNGDTVNTAHKKVSNDTHFSSSFSTDHSTPDQQGFTFMKRYHIKGKAGQNQKVVYSKILSKNAIYHYSIHPNTSIYGVRVEVYNSANELVISNHRNGRYYKALDFLVENTGIYHLRITFENPNNYQAELVLGFKRK